jgi:hypothetical protein
VDDHCLFQLQQKYDDGWNGRFVTLMNFKQVILEGGGGASQRKKVERSPKEHAVSDYFFSWAKGDSIKA